MIYDEKNREIKLGREPSNLDNFVLEFTKFLGNYVIVSGYVSILLGRSRTTDDVDLIAPEMSLENFSKLFSEIHEAGFECINTSKPEEAFDMAKNENIRFSRKKMPVPNIEFKFIQNKMHKYSFDNKIKVILENGVLFISPLEMQIVYKLYLGKQGNRKDLEDAKHLYVLFNEKINKSELDRLIKDLNVEKEFEKIK
jgi:hypothetical protein